MNEQTVNLSDAKRRISECVELLRVLVETETPTGDVDNNLRIAELLEGELTRAGAKVERVPAPGLGVHLVGRFSGKSGRDAAPILLLGHMDTVHGVGTLERLPFAVEDGRVWGPGSYDMKGGLATSIMALRLLAEKGGGPATDLSFVITCDEERGSPHSRALIEDEAQASRLALVVEPSVPGGAAKCRRKGVAAYGLSIEGKAAHSGIEPEKGASAVHEIARQVIRMHELANPAQGTTVNIGVIRGGTRENIVADLAHCTVDVRFWTRTEAERIHDELCEARPFDKRCKLTIEGGINRWALEETEDSKRLFRTARSIAAALGFELGAGQSGGASDGNIAAGVGCTTLDGLGPDGAGAHTLEECVVLEDLPRRMALMAALFDAL